MDVHVSRFDSKNSIINKLSSFSKIGLSFTVLFLISCDGGSNGSGEAGLPALPNQIENSRAFCSDKIDNDTNGKIDCDEDTCKLTSVCSANVEISDGWGDYWDGVPRTTQTHAVAEKTCVDIGARLPTATELFRNQIKNNTSDLTQSDEYIKTTKTGSEKLWTTIERQNTTDQFLVKLLAAPANTFVSVAAKTSSNEFRCIWPSFPGHDSGFGENNCNGPADNTAANVTRCFEVEDNLNMDIEPRAPLDSVGAAQECRMEGASIPVVADYAKAIPAGLPNGSTNWEYTGNAISWVDANNFGIALVRFNDTRTEHWSYDRVAPIEGGARDNGITVSKNRQFRCIGLANHSRWGKPDASKCTKGANNECFHYIDGRTHVVADAVDRSQVTTFPVAANKCRALGAELPNQVEFSDLVRAGWVGSNKYLWMSDPVLVTSGGANSLGNAVGKWKDAGTSNWFFGNAGIDSTKAKMRTPNTLQSYRCVWHTRIGKLPTCAINQAIQRIGDTYSCINTVDGDAAGKAKPSGTSKPDFRGNKWDSENRPKADFVTAKSNCEIDGARLPTANEIYVARGNAPSNAITSPSSPDVNLWSLNPAPKTGQHTVVTIVNGVVKVQADTISNFYRCIWQATRTNVLSDRSCHGISSNNCYQVKVDLAGNVSNNEDLIADSEDRVAMTMPSARAECQQAGGKLPDLREFTKLTHNSWPNGSNNFLWIDEALNWGSTGYGYALGKWLGDGTPAWQFDSALYGSQSTSTAKHNFRCVYSTVVR